MRAKHVWAPTAVLVAALAAPAAAPAALPWHDCDDGFECATAKVPLDYDHPHGKQIELALIRKPATDPEHRIGSLFIHPGGSGGAGVRFVRNAPPAALAPVARRFDVVGVDTRGLGASRPAIDCDTDPERLGVYAQPFPRPETLDAPALIARTKAYARRCRERNGELLAHMSSADMARDFDQLREAVGDKKLTFIGNSYGSLVGATYASLFPGRARALALTAPVDADTWVNRPFEAIREQSAALEYGMRRFFAACGGCAFANGGDPQDAFDDLLARLDSAPVGDVDGDDLRVAVMYPMISKARWKPFADALYAAQHGDGAPLRAIVDLEYEKGTNAMDVLWATLANDQRYPNVFQPFLDGGRHSASLFDYTAFNSGYGELAFALSPGHDGFAGPFRNPSWATPALLVSQTHDTFTPHQWAPRLAADLGNARLLTARGDGHDVLTGGNPCVFGALLAYLENQTLPDPGARC
jgi:pimeloyl-ACP methyl ester carboxylesterase